MAVSVKPIKKLDISNVSYHLKAHESPNGK